MIGHDKYYFRRSVFKRKVEIIRSSSHSEVRIDFVRGIPVFVVLLGLFVFVLTVPEFSRSDFSWTRRVEHLHRAPPFFLPFIVSLLVIVSGAALFLIRQEIFVDQGKISVRLRMFSWSWSEESSLLSEVKNGVIERDRSTKQVLASRIFLKTGGPNGEYKIKFYSESEAPLLTIGGISNQDEATYLLREIENVLMINTSKSVSASQP